MIKCETGIAGWGIVLLSGKRINQDHELEGEGRVAYVSMCVVELKKDIADSYMEIVIVIIPEVPVEWISGKEM